MVCSGCCRTRATVPGPEISVRNYPMSQNHANQSLRFSSKEMRENNFVSGFCALGKTFQTRTECQVNSENYDEM